MSELVCLELGIVLWIAHVLIQAGLAGGAWERVSRRRARPKA